MGTADQNENDTLFDKCYWLLDINIISFGILI